MRRWVSALLVAVGVFALLPIAPAAAHAEILGSDPVDGSVVARSPHLAQLRFSEEVLTSASSVTLVHVGGATITGLKISTTNGGSTVNVTLPELERGAYLLRFVVVDPADLHQTSGSISFGVGTAAPPSESGEQVISEWQSIVLRTITDGALLLLIGAVVIMALGVRSGAHRGDVAMRIGVACGLSVAIGWIALLILDASTVGVRRVQWGSLLLHSDPGHRALVGVQLAIGLWWGSKELNRSTNERARAFVVRVIVVIATGFVLAAAYGGHAGIGGNFAVGVAVRALHLAALGIWIGAVAILWWLSRRDVTMRSLWPPVSALAAIGLALAGATGLVLSGRVVVNVTAMLASTYGKFIVAKIIGLGVLVLLGAFASRSARRGTLPSKLWIELGVASIVVAFAALLASSAPARGEQFLPEPAASPQIVTSDVRDLTVSATIEPARPGPNLVNISVLNTRRPSPGPVTNVVLRLMGADGTTVARREGVPVAGSLGWDDINLPAAGAYRVVISITRPASSVPDFDATWAIDRAPVPRVRGVLSKHAWAPIAALLAALWIVIIGLVRMAYGVSVRTTDTDERRGRSSRQI